MSDIFANPCQFTLNRRIWCFILFALLATLLCIYAHGMHLVLGAVAYGQLFCLAVFFTVALVTRYIKRNDILFFYSNCYAQIILLYFIGSSLSYLGATLHFPLTDATLMAIDKAIGFHWQSYVSWMNAQPPWMSDMLQFAYYSFMVQTFVVVSMIFFLGRTDHGQRLVLAVIFTSLATALVATLFPAAGIYAYLHIDPAQFARLNPHLAQIHEELLFTLRNGTTDTLLYPSQGIITMPSFHTIMAVLFAYASWPFRGARLFIIPNNILLVIATPIYGGHYLIDVLSGLAIAFLGIAFAKYFLPNNRYVCIDSTESKPIIQLPQLQSLSRR